MAVMNFYVRIGEKRYTKVSCERFYSEWKKSYSPDDYENIIGWGKTEINLDQLEKIWKWKSPQWGKRFYERSRPMLDKFNEFRKARNPNLETFWEEVAREVSRTGFIYQAFAVHIARPSDYPMVDQHVCRAYLCISSEPPHVFLKPRQLRQNCTSFDVFHERFDPYRKFWFAMMKQLALSQDNVADNRRLDTAIRNFGIKLLEDYRQPKEFGLQVE